MKTTDKQIAANRVNALKSTGPTTEVGKVISSRNSLKHGLLAKEVVITAGAGAENREEFDVLLTDLSNQFKPVGTLEEMLVEKIAVAYWRLRRAHRYEVGLLRHELDDFKQKYYDAQLPYSTEKINKTDDEINHEIRTKDQAINDYQKIKSLFADHYKSGDGLEKIFNFTDEWFSLGDSDEFNIDELCELSPAEIRDRLNEAGLTDDDIWKKHLDLLDDYIDSFQSNIDDLRNEKEKNELALQVKEKLASIPDSNGLDQLLKYETAIDRQFYKAIDQLERIQRLRAGDNVPSPLKIDLDVNNSGSG